MEMLKELMYNYFRKCQLENPSLFFMQSKWMKIIAWGIAFWQMHGLGLHSVTLGDATYLTNRYSMPFVPFTGVNNHHQSIMFGCALLLNGRTES